MAALTDTELARRLKSGEYSSVYYFYGRDVANISAHANALSARLVSKENSEFNLHRFDGRSIDMSELYDAVNALPVFADRTCTMVNDLDADGLSSSDLDILTELVASMPEGAVLIFYATGISIIPDGKKAPSAKNKKLIDAVSKHGVVCDFAYKKPADMAKLIVSAAKKRGSLISRRDAEYLATQCLCDTALIMNEVDKLSAYANGGEITAETIDLLVSKQLDTTAFTLAKSVVALDAARSMRLLDELFSRRLEPVVILSAISSAFLDLYRAKTATLAGVAQSSVVSDFGYGRSREFAVANAFRDSGRAELSHLRRCVAVLNDADIALKYSSAEGRFVIERAIAQMLLR